ncbi:MAG TPA: SRPBCC family protein [Lysobacter sp.]
MASVHRQIEVEVPLEQAWDALRDVGRIHERLVPGFVVDCHLHGRVRTVTFADGTVVREPILDIDDERHRVAWAALGEGFDHYSASLQADDAGTGRTRLAWVADLLPDEMEPRVDGMVEQALATMKATLERARR